MNFCAFNNQSVAGNESSAGEHPENEIGSFRADNSHPRFPRRRHRGGGCEQDLAAKDHEMFLQIGADRELQIAGWTGQGGFAGPSTLQPIERGEIRRRGNGNLVLDGRLVYGRQGGAKKRANQGRNQHAHPGARKLFHISFRKWRSNFTRSVVVTIRVARSVVMMSRTSIRMSLGTKGQRFPLQLGLEEGRCLSLHRSSGKLTSQKPGGSMISNPTSKANSLAPAAVHTTRPRVKRCESRFRISRVVPTGNCLRLRIIPPYMLMTSGSTGSHSSG